MYVSTLNEFQWFSKVEICTHDLRQNNILVCLSIKAYWIKNQ